MNDMMTIGLGLAILLVFWILRMAWSTLAFVVTFPIRMPFLIWNFIQGFRGKPIYIPEWMLTMDDAVITVDKKLEEASYNIESAQKARLWMEERKKKPKASKPAAEVING